jgi:hypothetical protein
MTRDDDHNHEEPAAWVPVGVSRTAPHYGLEGCRARAGCPARRLAEPARAIVHWVSKEGERREWAR